MFMSKGDTKMSWRRGKTSGWAAFDLQQRQKDHFGAQPSNEPFPSLSNCAAFHQPSITLNNHLSMKPFSSVIVPSVSFPATLGNKKSEPSEVGSSIAPQSSETAWDNKFGSVFRQLKEHYCWADDGLIEDVMAAVDNDFDKASSFLKAVVSNENLERNKHSTVVKSGCDSTELVSDEKTLLGRREAPSKKTSEPYRTCSVLSSLVGDDNGDIRDEFDLFADDISDGCPAVNTMLGQSASTAVEPEWEEDDLYLNCRKDAIKMMRAAARHSKSATNAFLRGDHFAAQQLSQKAREEWAAAKKLNMKAAHEILSMRNENNGLWKLDLHGLHAAEAVQALQERLYTIDTQLLTKNSSAAVLTNSLGTKVVVSHASSGGFNNIERLDQQAVSGRKPKHLEVITGRGNHSRGGAALPTAVKTFLADNGYRFDEARPGVIMVCPKFLHV